MLTDRVLVVNAPRGRTGAEVLLDGALLLALLRQLHLAQLIRQVICTYSEARSSARCSQGHSSQTGAVHVWHFC